MENPSGPTFVERNPTWLEPHTSHRRRLSLGAFAISVVKSPSPGTINSIRHMHTGADWLASATGERSRATRLKSQLLSPIVIGKSFGTLPAHLVGVMLLERWRRQQQRRRARTSHQLRFVCLLLGWKCWKAKVRVHVYERGRRGQTGPRLLLRGVSAARRGVSQCKQDLGWMRVGDSAG